MIEYITLGILIFGVVAGIARSIWGSPRSTADIADSIKAIELNIHGVVKSQALLLDKVEWIEDQIKVQWRRIEKHDADIAKLNQDIVKINTICEERSRPIACEPGGGRQ